MEEDGNPFAVAPLEGRFWPSLFIHEKICARCHHLEWEACPPESVSRSVDAVTKRSFLAVGSAATAVVAISGGSLQVAVSGLAVAAAFMTVFSA
ncbi:hypothetical protein ACGFYF_42225 [Streptomyces lavendulae]|uniref:hypothetical protein n=1 Tax=Streptomyces lavendulae TaxID=1914 RepID=UPI00371586F2